MKTVKQLHKRWLKEPSYREAHKELEDEFEMSRVLIEARTKANLTQAEEATIMETSRDVSSCRR